MRSRALPRHLVAACAVCVCVLTFESLPHSLHEFFLLLTHLIDAIFFQHGMTRLTLVMGGLTFIGLLFGDVRQGGGGRGRGGRAG